MVIHPGPGLARALLAFSRNACTEAGTSSYSAKRRRSSSAIFALITEPYLRIARPDVPGFSLPAKAKAPPEEAGPSVDGLVRSLWGRVAPDPERFKKKFRRLCPCAPRVCPSRRRLRSKVSSAPPLLPRPRLSGSGRSIASAIAISPLKRLRRARLAEFPCGAKTQIIGAQ